MLESMTIEGVVRFKYRALSATLNERSRRLWAATEAIPLGRGWVALVMRATGLAFNTIFRGMREVREKKALAPDRARHSGGGRKSYPNLDFRRGEFG